MAPPTSGHIMLSYQWGSQPEVLRVKERLEKDGFDVWMDLDEMQGNIFQKMAEGVEGASLMVICMSSKYETSINCNREMQYAQVKEKKIVPIKLESNYNPSGALGLIVAGSLYIDFTDSSKFEDNIVGLEKEINAALGKAAATYQAPVAQKAPEDHRMRVKWVEQRCGSWNGGADKVINALKGKGVKRDQLISINAHNNGKAEDAIFVGFYDLNEPGNGDLNLAYEFQNESYGWDKFYQTAAQQIQGIKANDVVSLTGCCNERGRSVFYAFIQFPSQGSDSLVRYVQSRSGSWNGAADGVIGALVANGARQGQLLSIDAHNNGENEDAIFSAFWDPSLPATGPLAIGYKGFNAKHGWPTFYDNVAAECNKMNRKDLVSITGSINTSDYSVMYVFYYKR